MVYVLAGFVSIALIVVIVGLARAARGALRDLENLDHAISRLLELQDPRISLVIRECVGPRFLQFRMSELVKGEEGVELWLTDAGWMEGFRARIIAESEIKGLKTRVVVVPEQGAYLVVSLGCDKNMAADFGRDILINEAGLEPNDKVRVSFDVHKAMKAGT